VRVPRHTLENAPLARPPTACLPEVRVTMTNLRADLQSTLGTAYSLERELGGGGMSRVFLAEETALGRKVVVKVLPPELTAGVNVDRFKREIQVAARLQHAHIVPVLTAGEMSGVPYYTMPFVEGESLRARIARTGPLPITEAIGVMRDVAKALAYAHDRGLVHRDIKPDNVMLSGGSAMVVDFGIAKAISASRTDAPGGTLTQIGTSIGTPAYMAPEQAAGDPATDQRADLYSFGCTAYEALTGRPPFTATTPQKLLAAHMSETPEPVGKLRLDVPDALAALIGRCLEKDADHRPSAPEIVRQVDTITSGGGHAAMPPILVGGPGMLKKALGLWASAFVTVAIVAKAAVVGIGLPVWVVPGAIIVMALGLPVILFTGYVHHTTRRIVNSTPRLTPGGTPSMQHGTMQTIALKASPHMSWRRTTLGGAYAIGAFMLLIGGFMVLRALGIGPAGSLLAAGRISNREPLLVTDFKVTNADTTLGRVLSDAAKTQLAQSSVITLLPPEGVAAALRRMTKPVNSNLDLTLARELAQRNGIKAIVDGEINGLGAGAGFIVTMKLVTTDSLKELASFRQTANDAQGLIGAVDQLSRQLRGRVGESLKRVNTGTPLAQATTASLEALTKYTEGMRAEEMFSGRRQEAIALLREAVQIDPTFAEAWRKLGIIHANMAAPSSVIDSALTQAYRYRDRVPEYSRDYIVANYYAQGPGRDRAKAIAAFEAMLRRGDTARIGISLGLLLLNRRDYAGAELLYQAHERAAPGTFRPIYANLFNAQMRRQRFAAADSVLTLGISNFPDFAEEAERRRIDMRYPKGDSAGFRRAADSVYIRGDSAGKAWARPRVAAQALLDGRVALWRTRFSENRPETPTPRQRLQFATNQFDARVTATILNRPADVIRRLDEALPAMAPIPETDRPYIEAARVYAWAGRPDKARAMLARRDAEVKDTAFQRETSWIRSEALGEILLAERKGAEAVVEFRRADRRPDGPSNACNICLSTSLARAFDVAGQVDSAIVHYERSVSEYSFDRMSGPFLDPLLLAPYSKRLGELYEQKGDRATSARHYRNFVNLWKNADAELQPQVAEVRRRLSRLADIETGR
jgi:tRNA A-37 threonylcarbamoyl transferase component Bud32/tetratricopeptide (TPR) repeat protein